MLLTMSLKYIDSGIRIHVVVLLEHFSKLMILVEMSISPVLNKQNVRFLSGPPNFFPFGLKGLKIRRFQPIGKKGTLHCLPHI